MPFKDVSKKKEYDQKRYQIHKEEVRLKQKEYYRTHKDQYRQYQRQNPLSHEQKEVHRNYVRENFLCLNGNNHVRVKKRPFTIRCELCGKEQEFHKAYHHWNDEKPELGIWICLSCHNIAEGVEANLHTKYLNLKELRASDEPIHNLC
jgi:hypothetical protein